MEMPPFNLWVGILNLNIVVNSGIAFRRKIGIWGFSSSQASSIRLVACRSNLFSPLASRIHLLCGLQVIPNILVYFTLLASVEYAYSACSSTKDTKTYKNEKSVSSIPQNNQLSWKKVPEFTFKELALVSPS